MLVISLDGKSHKLKLQKSDIEDNNRSSFHLKTRTLLKEIYPSDVILEEINIPATKLHIDFFIPLRKLVVEVHGLQHYYYNKFFHKSVGDFHAGRHRDSLKREFCVLNNFTFVELDCRENIDEWRKHILGAFIE